MMVNVKKSFDLGVRTRLNVLIFFLSEEVTHEMLQAYFFYFSVV